VFYPLNMGLYAQLIGLDSGFMGKRGGTSMFCESEKNLNVHFGNFYDNLVVKKLN